MAFPEAFHSWMFRLLSICTFHYCYKSKRFPGQGLPALRTGTCWLLPLCTCKMKFRDLQLGFGSSVHSSGWIFVLLDFGLPETFLIWEFLVLFVCVLIHSFHNYFCCLLVISLGGVRGNLTLNQNGFFESLVFMIHLARYLWMSWSLSPEKIVLHDLQGYGLQNP